MKQYFVVWYDGEEWKLAIVHTDDLSKINSVLEMQDGEDDPEPLIVMDYDPEKMDGLSLSFDGETGTLDELQQLYCQ